LWDGDADRLNLEASEQQVVLDDDDQQITEQLHLAGHVNRLDAWLVAHAVQRITHTPLKELLTYLDKFPGVGRRFEYIAPNLVSDYAHTAPKIRGALQAAGEVAGDNVVVVYEGLHNTRQHFMKNDLKHLFDGAKKLYIVPSYLAREDPNLAMLHPGDIKNLLDPLTQTRTQAAELDDKLKHNIQEHLKRGDLVLCLTAGGGNSLDEWLRQNFSKNPKHQIPNSK
jgi:UDP-N-acetylmuramate--alanine ligase